jgi:hypothetical protein
VKVKSIETEGAPSDRVKPISIAPFRYLCPCIVVPGMVGSLFFKKNEPLAMTIGKISPLSKGLLCVASPHSLLDSAFRLRSTVTNSAEITRKRRPRRLALNTSALTSWPAPMRRRCACYLGTNSLSAFCSIRAAVLAAFGKSIGILLNCKPICGPRSKFPRLLNLRR